ncbi:MAG TPA: glycosyltransferase [Thermoanaerobaculia bacterium]|nr:glycosyltransferase [Thermoanaerobaculia bacterium]
MRTLIVIPVYNDWESLRLLLARLDDELSSASVRASLLIVDDGSSLAAGTLLAAPPRALDELRILTLRRNLGHQRAIAVALAYCHENLQSDEVVVMDGDGEDDPADVPRLIAKSRAESSTRIVFARRARRSEGIRFVTLYVMFRALYRLLTGLDIRVGNFSIIPSSLLRRLVVVSEIWSHYVSGIMKARLPYTMIDTARGKRLAGQSQMNYVGLITHGLSAIAVNGDVFGVRMLMAMLVIVIFALILMFAAIAIKLGTNLAFPNWATSVVAFSTLTILQAIGLSLFFVFLILNGRSQLDMIPERDHVYFVLDCAVIYP